MIDKVLTLDETFALALENHKKNNIEIAINLYNKVLKIEPNYIQAYYNLGIAFNNLKQKTKALECYKKVIEINPDLVSAYNNLGVILQETGQHKIALDYYEKAIKINPNHTNIYNNLGVVYQELGEQYKAKNCFENVIKIDPNYKDSYNNLGVVLQELGKYKEAIKSYEQAIKLDINFVDAYNNLGTTYYDLGKKQKAINFYKKAISINNQYNESHWNLHGTSSNIEDALSILKRLKKVNNENIKAKIMITILEAYKGNFEEFNKLLSSSYSDHPITRSAKWIFSLSKLPKILFSRWDFFDSMIDISVNKRPFYEFGVWNGISFKYLINTFKKGFGFDTFTGIPKSWHNEPSGTYSSFGSLPKIKGGEFIVGEFKDTLPSFFSKKKPVASIVNFDADLYTSTLCALNYSKEIIDEKTILIFDEFIRNKYWEEDEYKALNEFCKNSSFRYEVIAVSFFTGQVAVKIIKN